MAVCISISTCSEKKIQEDKKLNEQFKSIKKRTFNAVEELDEIRKGDLIDEYEMTYDEYEMTYSDQGLETGKSSKTENGFNKLFIVRVRC